MGNHRAVIKTEDKYSKGSGAATRKLLSFFLINPDNETFANMKSVDCKWYNYPMKTDVFVNYMLDYNMDFIDGISVEIIALIGYFAFGNDDQQRKDNAWFTKTYFNTNDNNNSDYPF